MPFVESLLKLTERYESPTSFWRWSAYSTISAILRDNCCKLEGTDRLYPNMYVLLLADSAVHRKGRPVRLCEKLTGLISNTKIISGRTSVQAILDELGRAETNSKTGVIIKGGSGIFTAQELAASVVSDPSAIQILTDIYDFKDEYTHRLRGMPMFRINNLCFSSFAASNEDLLKDVYDQRALFGGLLGRTFLIKPNEFRAGNSLFDIDNFDFSILKAELDQIRQIKGNFIFPPEVQKLYDNWYLPFRTSYEKKSDKSGVIGRIHTGVLKLAMVKTVNRTKDLVVGMADMEEAIDECMALMPNYREFLMGAPKANPTNVGAILLTDMYNEPCRRLARRRVLERHWSDFDADILEKQVATLSQAGMIQVDAVDGEIYYTLTPRCIELLFSKNGDMRGRE